MAVTNYALAKQLQDLYPDVFEPLQHLVMAMADTISTPTTDSFTKLESILQVTLKALESDFVVAPGAEPSEYRKALVELLGKFKAAFPNWLDAYGFAEQFLVDDAAHADERIAALLRQ